MKIFSSFILSLCSVLGFSQTILYQSESSSRTVQDPQAVVLAQGFHATSNVSNPFVAKLGPATDNPGGGPTNSGAGANNPSGSSAPSGESFHDTKGSIDVTAGGQFQFTLPIALPPGVKSVAPQINLVYTSGSGNGIAGYGWNLYGITGISRVGKNIDKDGKFSTVKLDYSDYYSFNGQRLILKSGEYGKDGAEYVTEKYSNIKIKSIGSVSGQPWKGPLYWEITFEDGSQSWYGSLGTGDSAARTPVEYNIVKWRDPQGNYISYSYIQSNNVAVIDGIRWGGNEVLQKNHTNDIKFLYNEDRGLQELSYLQGVEFIQQRLLKNIVVRTGVDSSPRQFKRYEVQYDANTIVDGNGQKTVSYKFANQIKEFNTEEGYDNAANAISFSSKPLSTSITEKTIGDMSNVVTTGDFNGDGLIDFIVKRPVSGSLQAEYYLYFDAVNSGFSNYVYLGNDSKLFPGFISNTGINTQLLTLNLKPSNNILKAKQGILAISSKRNYMVPYSPYLYDIELRYYSVRSDAYVLNTTNDPLVLEYSRTISPTEYEYDQSIYPNQPNPGFSYVDEEEVSSFIKAKEIDIDSDGLSEIMISIADQKCYKRELSTYPEDEYRWDCDNAGNRFIVIDKDDIANNTIHITAPMTRNIFQASGNGSVAIMDFDNDTVQDVMLVESQPSTSTSSVNVSFYTKQAATGEVINQTVNTPLNNLSQYAVTKENDEYMVQLKKTYVIKGLIENIQFGDLNGDKNIEVLLPLNRNTQSSVHYAGWAIYLNTGNNLSESCEGLTQYFRNTDYTLTYRLNSHPALLDIDNDGKSNFIDFYAGYNVNDGFSNLILSNMSEFQYNPNNTQFKWSYKRTPVFANLRGGSSFTPLYGDFRINGNVSKINFISQSINNPNDRKIISFRSFDLNADKNITSITQGGITTNIDYKELEPIVSPNFYAPTKTEQYPFMEHDRMSQSYAVSQMRQTVEYFDVQNQVYKTGERKQDFRYRGYITNFHGKESVGFRQTARSSWYANGYESTKVWSGMEIDPLNEGIPVKEWTIRTNNEGSIFPADLSENNTQLLTFSSTVYKTDKLLNDQIVATVSDADKYKIVTAIVPETKRAKDFLTNTLSVNTITYGNYYLPTKSVTNVNNGLGVATLQYSYLHAPAGIGKDYYIGRLAAKLEKNEAYSSFSSKDQFYTYENNLLKSTVTIVGADLGYNMTEEFKYDAFGNIIEEKVIADDGKSTKQEFAYDPKGRFVIKKKDNLGLETNITYNDWGQILTQIDPLGNTLENTYDNWGKLLTSKTNLSGTTTFQYIKHVDGSASVVQYAPDGDISRKYTNKFGQDYKTLQKGFNQGQFVSQMVQYDILGRKVRESESYFDNQSPSQWNTLQYDDSVFPSKITATSFTGKKMETSVSGNTTTVKEINGNGRINTETKDALGNIISTTDKGGTINFSYNAAGLQVKAQYAENIITTKYDVWGRKTELNDPSNGVYQYLYNGFGQPIKITSPKGTKEYTYNNLGQVITQREVSVADGGAATDKTISLVYDDKGRVTSKSGTSKGKPYSSQVTYDPQGRLLSSSESSNGKYFIEKGITYDDKARVISYEKQIYSSGVLTTIQLENVYSDWSGQLYQIKDKNSGKILWELQEANSKGQITKNKLGAATINNLYDYSGFLSNTTHSSQVKPSILQLSYTFDALKNELKTRTTGGDFNIVESFTYDDNNRLISWTNPRTNQTSQNTYDIKGRITANDQVGTIKFENTAKIYQPTGMTLNAVGEQNYNNDLIQIINYNENNDPVFIDGLKGDVAFEYGLTNMRQRVTYGGNFNADNDGHFTKFYSEDAGFEVVKDNTTGKEKHIIYIGGTPYESNIIFVKNYDETAGSYKFLHKDYLGSILAISDEAGNKLEQRHFDAWGNFTHLQIGNGAIITDKNSIDNASLLLDRGYTGHEHFAEVGIIHMNGRLYDPLLRRFLNADEHIQDPSNTQNYNKYGYVLNNPLMYNDPSGELFQFLVLAAFWKAVGIGIVIGTFSAVAVAGFTGKQIGTGGILKSAFFGALSGAVTFGIGSIFSTTAGAVTQYAAKLGEAAFIVKAVAHGVAQGALSLMQNGGFGSAFFSGVLGSLGASAFGAIVGNAANSTVGTIAFGALSGGIGAELSGGNFWQGAVIGGIIAGLNHELHKPKYVIAGIYGAGGHEASDNPLLEELVEKMGGRMFTSSVGGGDEEIIEYLLEGRKEGKQIKIYGHSRGGAAAVRIANKLGAMNIQIAEINLFDPVGMYFGGDFVFKHPNVLRVNNYYQRNPTDHLAMADKFELANNPFKGSPVSAKFQWPVIKQVDYTGQFYKAGVPVSHLNIIKKVYGR